MIAGAVAAVFIIAGALAFEPVTRNVVANDDLCSYCHLEWEFDPMVRDSLSVPMKATTEGDEIAHCVDCHIPEGMVGSFYAYLHFASLTDFFGHLRDLKTERAGTYLTPRAITSYRVRDRFFEYDSPTCRNCHDLSEMAEADNKAQKVHKKALEKKQTCIQCHTNLVHAPVDRRKNAFVATASGEN
jgi:cytochrome c-type protein NapC